MHQPHLMLLLHLLGVYGLVLIFLRCLVFLDKRSQYPNYILELPIVPQLSLCAHGGLAERALFFTAQYFEEL